MGVSRIPSHYFYYMNTWYYDEQQICASRLAILDIDFLLMLSRLIYYSEKYNSNPFQGKMFSHLNPLNGSCFANQLTGFYMRATLALNRLNAEHLFYYRSSHSPNYLQIIKHNKCTSNVKYVLQWNLKKFTIILLIIN